MKKIIVLTISDLIYEANLHRKLMSLTKSGCNVRLLAAYHPNLNIEIWQGIDLTRIRLIKKTTIIKFVHFLLFSFLWVIFRKADLYISYDTLPLLPVKIASALHRKPFIYDSVELLAGLNQLEEKPIRKKIWMCYEKRGIKGVNRLITVCQSDASHIKTLYKDLPEPVVVRNTPEFKRIKAGHQVVRNKFRIPADHWIGIYQGMLFEGRGLRNLIRAIPGRDKFTLIIVGQGPLMPELKNMAKELKIEDRVIYTGLVPFYELHDYTASADIGFTIISGKGLSYYHALPNKLFEYIQAGIPVIGSDYPEIKKIIEEDDIGYTVNPESVEEISQAIKKMLDEENYKKFKNRILKISEKYTWQQESQIYLRTIKSVLSEKI
ncbi:MAG: glycosyltransferase family 4 protein [Calditrichaceae bacterium]|nr:glycosyltransferase family 4 protein [Calditrichaceae bacterium]MBN2708736.1 glycosyltransferase family 4 protein [Calditrichaceae bacterium]RQV97103.1 MAG: glycosyltransferase [Calditrichota bacterium]